MDFGKLSGPQYVRLAPGAADEIVPYLGVRSEWIDELLLDLTAWPEEVRPTPRAALDGRLIPGDPLLVGANDGGLLFARRGPAGSDPVLVDWASVRYLDVVGRVTSSGLGVICHR